MNVNLVNEITKTQIRTDLPDFSSGDTIKVFVRIIEGGKERLQAFEGLVIARRGGGVSETFIIRKVSQQIGVERTFFVNSPIISRIEVIKRGYVRRAKIFYIRSKSGKSGRIKEAK